MTRSATSISGSCVPCAIAMVWLRTLGHASAESGVTGTGWLTIDGWRNKFNCNWVGSVVTNSSMIHHTSTGSDAIAFFLGHSAEQAGCGSHGRRWNCGWPWAGSNHLTTATSVGHGPQLLKPYLRRNVSFCKDQRWSEASNDFYIFLFCRFCITTHWQVGYWPLSNGIIKQALVFQYTMMFPPFL